ncbi:11225_t:CDS:10 [Paraglomus occultum]|uniref:11225_t:CDS:1 n=1 Tax=Paraglomus occultum TaxID=144539 RepID=A0A9N9BBW1_9GLOM|nr:11225_t:CDS:10 [Paraglomus occultum]
MSADQPTATDSSSNSPPSTFLALLNDNDDDHITNLLAETVPQLTQNTITNLENIPEFSGSSAPPLMPFGRSEDEDGEELLLDPEDWDERRHGEVGSSSEECEDDDLIPSFGRLLEEAESARTALEAEGSMPSFFAGSEEEWRQFTIDLRLTSGVGKIRRTRGSESALPPDIRAMIGEANKFYVTRDFQKATELLQEIVKRNPNIHRVWFTLALIHDELGKHERALQLFMVAAHLTPKDGALWKRLGLLSRKHNHMKQAIYCYSKAIKANSNDLDAVWDRSYLYAETGQLKKALEGYTQILKQMPDDMNVVREISKIHIMNNDIPQAISIFSAAFNSYLCRPYSEVADVEGSFGYSEINMLAELYMLQNDYQKAIDAIKKAVRWIQGREKETWWDAFDDDREYEEGEGERGVGTNRRSEFADVNSVRGGGGSNVRLPAELRVKLAQCRILLDQAEEGKMHLEYFYQYDIKSYIDLYYDVGETLMDKNLFEDALTTYEAILSTVKDKLQCPQACIQIGFCYRELGELRNALEYLKAAVKGMPNNLDVKLALAEVYEDLHEDAKALELVNEVLTIRQLQRISTNTNPLSANVQPASPSPPSPPSHPSTPDSILPLIPDDQSTPQSRSQTHHEELRQFAAEKREETRIRFHQLDLLSSRINAGEDSAAEEYLNTARALMDDWSNMKAFYPRDSRFRGLGRRWGRKRKGLFLAIVQGGEGDENEDVDLDVQAREMARRLKRNLAGENDEKTPVDQSKVMFQGVPVADWFDFFVQYAIIAVKHGRESEACDTLRRASLARVFYHDEPRKILFKLLLMACALHWNNFEVVCECARFFCMYKQFYSDTYLLYIASMSSGNSAVSCFASTNSAKFFIRQVKAFDELVERSRNNEDNEHDSDLDIDTEPNVVNKEQKSKTKFKPSIHSAALLLLHGHILVSARSYVAAIAYYTRAYQLSPNDPIISLCLGLAYLHRAMSRQTDNRHCQIFQGFSYLYNYCELRNRNQEAEFNLGRALHSIGLYHLAIIHYERALKLPSLREELIQKGQVTSAEIEEDEDDPTDLKRDIAYNMAMIYMESGSPALAQQLLRQHCTI